MPVTFGKAFLVGREKESSPRRVFAETGVEEEMDDDSLLVCNRLVRPAMILLVVEEERVEACPKDSMDGEMEILLLLSPANKRIVTVNSSRSVGTSLER